MTIDLHQLEQHAKQAEDALGPGGWYIVVPHDRSELQAFIAACDPTTITALCRAVQAAIKYRDWSTGVGDVRAAQDALDAALAPFRTDAA